MERSFPAPLVYLLSHTLSERMVNYITLQPCNTFFTISSWILSSQVANLGKVLILQEIGFWLCNGFLVPQNLANGPQKGPRRVVTKALPPKHCWRDHLQPL